MADLGVAVTLRCPLHRVHPELVSVDGNAGEAETHTISVDRLAVSETRCKPCIILVNSRALEASAAAELEDCPAREGAEYPGPTDWLMEGTL